MSGISARQGLHGRGTASRPAGRAMRPASATIEDGECPALLMDEGADGELLVCVPGAPVPGAVYIVTSDQVVLRDVSLPPFLQAISSWGLGLEAAVQKPRPPTMRRPPTLRAPAGDALGARGRDRPTNGSARIAADNHQARPSLTGRDCPPTTRGLRGPPRRAMRRFAQPLHVTSLAGRCIGPGGIQLRPECLRSRQ